MDNKNKTIFFKSTNIMIARLSPTSLSFVSRCQGDAVGAVCQLLWQPTITAAWFQPHRTTSDFPGRLICGRGVTHGFQEGERERR